MPAHELDVRKVSQEVAVTLITERLRVFVMVNSCQLFVCLLGCSRTEAPHAFMAVPRYPPTRKDDMSIEDMR